MAIEIKIPQISEGVETATVTEILVSEGDLIEKEQSVIAVESDKAAVEIPSSHAGEVKSIKVNENDEVNVGDVIMTLEESDDKEDDNKDKKNEASADDTEVQEKNTSDQKKPEKDEVKDDTDKEQEEVDESEEKKNNEDDKTDDDDDGNGKEETSSKNSSEKKTNEKPSVPASPGVRRFARELGVSISEVKGSGENGRISKDDIKTHAKDSKTSRTSQNELPDFSQWGETKRKKISGIRKTTATKVTNAWQNIPHVFQFDEADITEIEGYMSKNQDKANKAGTKLTITAVLTKLVADGLEKFPKFNASLDLENEEMVLKDYINIGIAVDTEKGLLLPVIKKVDKKGIVDLAVEISKLAEKARHQKLTGEEMKGGNFSISNLGGIGGTNFTPIIYHPQVAILGVSRAQTKPIYVDGQLEARKILPLSLSYDHRLIDGAEAARFITWLKNALEDPFEALLS
ncbi:MAG: 2-oxo acid dehydrogenase subunit E2 [Psychroflexus sp.]|nr:2-oxo acid dehydrogenase subunit E2 [Psychroflexus sp.]MDN6309419.1 2-oxo acid dehydrogenase subunit E2 [Psychroflexus sp.]